MDKFMSEALTLANKAYKKGEIPIGAIIVKNGKVISRAYNIRETKKNALFHAEILAINKACRKLKSWRLNDCEMFVTLEPCAMCAGAILNSRISKLYYGAKSDKDGFAGSLYNLFEKDVLNHRTEVIGGVMKSECAELLKRFFKEKREI